MMNVSVALAFNHLRFFKMSGPFVFDSAQPSASWNNIPLVFTFFHRSKSSRYITAAAQRERRSPSMKVSTVGVCHRCPCLP